MSNLSRLTVGDLETICPAVLTQVLLPSCPHTVQEESYPFRYSGQLLHPFVCAAPSQLKYLAGHGGLLFAVGAAASRGCEFGWSFQ